MSAGKMHLDEVETDVALVRRLLAEQFPQWARLPLAPVTSAGTDNALYRLGDEMVVRLPRIHWAVDAIDIEQEWLPRLAPHLPLAIPAPLAKGIPGEGYPWPWSIYPWLHGEDAFAHPPADQRDLAVMLARFIAALRRIDPTGAPLAGRGEPLANRDEDVRAALLALDGALDTEKAATAWEACMRAPVWEGPPVWVHGDLQPLNLIIADGRLSAVIDWGGMGVGDPACDTLPAWCVFSPDMRVVFRAELAVDDAMWARGRGWALCFGLVALPYYQGTNPTLAAIARRAIDEAIADFECR